MISDFRSTACADRFEVDLCIVGGGPAGLTIARELAGTPWRICLLESGGQSSEPESQALNAGLSVGPHLLDPATSRLRALGGATRIWGGGCIPMSSLELARREWVPDSGWPLGWEELAPYYARANRICGVEPGEMVDGSYQPPAVGRGLPAPSLEPRICRMRPQDFGQVHLPLLQAASNVQLVLHATLMQLEASADARRVQRAFIASTDGRRGQVVARCFVLAAGGIENARLLLLSDAAMPQGLGNAHDMVGRCFMDHPRCGLGSFEAGQVERLADWCRRPLDRARAPATNQLSLSGHAQRTHHLLNARFWPFAVERPAPGLHALRELRASLRRTVEAPGSHVERHLLDALARDLPVRPRPRMASPPRARLALRTAVNAPDVIRAGVRKLAGRAAVATERVEMVGYFEQVPDRESRITLSDQRDALGLRKVQVDWRLTGRDIDNIRTASMLVGQDVARQYDCRFVPADWLRDPGQLPPVQATAHHMGTTRMSDSPATGVVDRNCRTHGVENLYVAGSSVFPTGGWSFPTLTITALAIRLADELRLRMTELSMLGML
ncbi:FAD-dependent oxidoreductase [Luteimonas sp. SDU101]|uniref:FAD-dependent oxidoreductase n=1 Tax=Luteimonas sp. SDU101 TaxID=3422593 RepID=UPI003EBD5A78